MFRLRKVLEWKEARERELRIERIALERRISALDEEIADLVRRRGEMPDEAPPGESTVGELAQWSGWAEGMRRRERRVRERRDALLPELERRTREHMDARQEAEGLRKLAEREQRRRKKRIERKQQEQIDDAATRRRLPGPGRDFPPDDDRGPHTFERNTPENGPELADSPNRGKRS